MVMGYRNARRALVARDRRIFNATVGGHLEVFERRDLSEV
jgi:hypothetical protein